MWPVYLFAAVVLMGFNVLVVKKLMKHLDPVKLLFYQYLVALPVVGVYAAASGSLTIHSSSFLLGFLYIAGIACFYAALQRSEISKVSPVFNMKMLVTSGLGVVFLSEPLTPKLVLGLGCGVIAVFLLGGEGL